MNNELHAMIEYMERERGIDRESLIVAVESALLSASKKSMGPTRNLRISIDRKTFRVLALAEKTVTDKKTASSLEIPMDRALKIKPDAKVGEVIDEEINTEALGRIAAQTAKQAIMHKIRQAEREKMYNEYKDRVGDLVSGSVRRFERNDVIIELNHGEAVMPSRERVPTEEYQMGDRIRCYVVSVSSEGHPSDILLSRSHPGFVKRLFELEVSEIADGTVEVKGIAREAGFRTKLAVHSKDEKVDPVGACVGLKGNRVKNIVRELGGEKVDIVRYSDDIKTFVTNSLSPAKLSRLEVDEPTRTVKVIVGIDQLSLAIGKKGQNARLTSKLTGWKIDVKRDGPEGDFKEQVANALAELAKVPGITENTAERLVHSGFISLEQLVSATLDDLVAAEEFTPAEAQQIKQAADAHFEKIQTRLES
jgi:transcription termination/antitermination protein NusA